MAVRENQGLQISLIIFALLMIVTGVCAFMFFRWYEEAQLATKASIEEKKKAIERETLAQAEVGELKKLYGAAPTNALATIQENFKEDMKNYGANFKESDQHYRYLVKFLHKELLDAQSRFVDDKVREEELKSKIAAEEKVKLVELAKYKESLDKSVADLKTERDAFNESLKEVEKSKTDIAKQIDSKRKDADDHTKKASDEVHSLTSQLERAGRTINDLKKDRERKAAILDLPRGKITWVDQRERVVWINVGSADGLRRGVTFEVLGPDEPILVDDKDKYKDADQDSGNGSSKSKGSIEVVRMLDNHLAEARILKDKLTDPILPGDQIFSQIWAPGRVVHFALVGFMDVDNDRASDRPLIKSLIANSGGVVDAEVTDDGKRVGDVSLRTNYMIDGASLTEKGSPEFLKTCSEMRGECKNLGIQTIPLERFLNNVGYVMEEHSVAMDKNATPTDFMAKPRDGVLRKSNAQFAPRKPHPVSTKPSAY